MITILQNRSDTTLEGVELKNGSPLGKSWREKLIFLLSSPSLKKSVIFSRNSGDANKV